MTTIYLPSKLTKGTGRFNVSQGAVSTAFGAGAGFGPSIGGFVVASAGFSAAFLTLAAIACLAVLLLFALMPETAATADPEAGHIAGEAATP